MVVCTPAILWGTASRIRLKDHTASFLFPSSFFSKHFITVQVVQPYSSNDMATAWKNFHFIRKKKHFSSVDQKQCAYMYLTPLHEQDVRQGQFLSKL